MIIKLKLEVKLGREEFSVSLDSPVLRNGARLEFMEMKEKLYLTAIKAAKGWAVGA